MKISRRALKVGAASLLTPALILGGLLWTDTAGAQTLSLDMGEGGGEATARIVQLILLMSVLTLAPSILIMMTSFTRIVIVLSFLRTAMGTQQVPSNQILVSLAMFMTLFVMMPTMERMYDEGMKPMMDGSISEEQALERGMKPLKDFMMSQVREKDLALFVEIGNLPEAEARSDDISLRVLVPGFMLSEIRRAFEIGFLIFVPFLVIDMVVASVLMSMGMMMLPPVIVALPFKIVFFVLVDGWYMIVGSLVRSFGG